MTPYNLVVVGGGAAGLTVAAGAAGLGARVALVEGGLMGGDCLNYGCVPSKALLRVARQARASGRELPWPEVMAQVRGAVDSIAPHDSVDAFRAKGVEVFQGRARLISPREVEVTLTAGGRETLRGKGIVIATGSRPLLPPLPGLEAAGCLTNETVFSLPERPGRLLVLGGGPIGVELSQAFARLGSKVTLVERLPRLLPREDADAAAEVTRALEADGVRVLTGLQVERVEGAPAGEKQVHCQPAGPAGTAPGVPSGEAPSDSGGAGTTLAVDAILVAVGRRANVEGLGLEALGVALEQGTIRVNSRMRTSVPSIWAAGDVAGPYQFTHMANQQARVLLQNALTPLRTHIRYRVVPWCTFTDPEVARVGLNEQEAAAQNQPVRVLHIPLNTNDRAICDGVSGGFLKVLTPPGRDDILGVTMVGPHAGEMIHEAVVAMQNGLRLRHLGGTVHIYPTLSEAFRRAGDEARKAAFTPRLQKIFATWMRWQRAF